MYKRFKLRKKKENLKYDVSKREEVFGETLFGKLVIFSVILNNETKKKLCDDEIKCSKKQNCLLILSCIELKGKELRQ